MASTSNSVTAVKLNEDSGQSNYRFALISLTSLFFMWGFITCLNDILIPHLKNMFSLNYTQAMLIQFCFFGAYFIVSIPAGKIVSKLGYQRGIVVGLMLACFGGLLFIPAASYQVYGFFLGALFVLASGITILQVSANPFVTVLGNPKTAPSRLTMTQAFNSLGTTVAPYFGAILILGAATETAVSGDSVSSTYLLLSAMLAGLALLFAFIKLPKFETDPTAIETPSNDSGSIMQQKHLVFGAMGIFVYVGAEVAIGSLLVNYLGLEHIAGLEESEGAKYLMYYWGGAMVGRFIGAAVMQKIAGGKALAFNALGSCILLLIAIFGSGQFAMWALLLVGLCNSIMFPTIFSLALINLKQLTAQGSGILCLAIVGGAIIPLVQGMLADTIGLQISFILPVICYVFIAWYGLVGSKPQTNNQTA